MISADSLPELTATTVVPSQPMINHTFLVISKSSISFDLLTSDDTGLYDVYLFLSPERRQKQVVNTNDDHIAIKFNFSKEDGDPQWVGIYGYDKNLSEYLSVSITIKPQTYQETVTTVTG